MALEHTQCVIICVALELNHWFFKEPIEKNKIVCRPWLNFLGFMYCVSCMLPLEDSQCLRKQREAADIHSSYSSAEL